MADGFQHLGPGHQEILQRAFHCLGHKSRVKALRRALGVDGSSRQHWGHHKSTALDLKQEKPMKATWQLLANVHVLKKQTPHLANTTAGIIWNTRLMTRVFHSSDLFLLPPVISRTLPHLSPGSSFSRSTRGTEGKTDLRAGRRL